MRVSRSYLKQRKEEDEKADRQKLRIYAFFFGFTLLHGFLFFSVVFNTLVPLLPLVCVYVSGTLALTYLLKAMNVKFYAWKAYAIFPSALHLLFCLNYFVSRAEAEETYRFYTTYEAVISRSFGIQMRKTTMLTSGIVLEDNMYSEYPGIRIFSSPDKFSGRSSITYTFSRGLLGMRVVKDYRFR